MTDPPATDNTQISTRRLHTYLDYLHLSYVREHHATLPRKPPNAELMCSILRR
jgi:hypothetical protein